MASQRLVQGIFFAVLLSIFAYLAVLVVRPFLTYLLAVVLLAFLFWPVQKRLAPQVGQRVSAFVLVAGAVAVMSIVVVLIVVLLPADAAELSRGLERLVTETQFDQRLEALLGMDIPFESILADVPQRGAEILIGDLSTILGAATDAFLGLILVLFLLYYLLKEGDRLVQWVTQMMPLPETATDELVNEVHESTWAVLKGHVFIAIVQAIVAGLGMAVVGLPNLVFWTVVMMVLGLFPIVGVAGVLGPAVLYLAFVDRLLAAGFLLVYGMTVVAVVDDYIRALVVDRESSLHSATILVGVFGGVYAFGVMGLFYGPIVLGLFKTLIRLFNENYVGES